MNIMLELVREGGIFMYPILAGALWALVLLGERTIFYLQAGSGVAGQSRTFFSHLEREGVQAAAQTLVGRRGVLRNVLAEALEHRGAGAQAVERKLEAVLLRDMPAYTRSLGVLAAIAALMPILGLLGTVSGMIQTFETIALQGTGDPRAMAAGISVALITTQAGLVVAVPVMLGHVLLTVRSRRIADTTHEACSRMLDYLKSREALDGGEA